MDILQGHIVYIERALGFKLKEEQIAYLLHNKVMPNVRNNGATTAYCIKLALSDGEPLDMSRPERYSDRQLSMGNFTYSRTCFRPTFLDIREKLRDIGFTVHPLKGDEKMEKLMKNYKVSFWFGQDADNGESTPDRVIFITTDKTEKREITALALREIGAYPRSYQVMVESVDTVEHLVVAISNSRRANGEAWYYNRDGEMFVVRMNNEKGVFETCHFLGVTSTRGYIKPEFCTIVHKFKSEETF